MDYFNIPVKASSLPASLLATAAVVLLAAAPARAQDTVVLKSGATREGKVTGVSGGNVRIQTPAGTVGAPLADVKEVRMAEPADLATAADKLAKGDAKGAAAILQKLNDAFPGLPAAWTQRALALLGDAKLEAGDKAGAQAAYDQFVKAYPQATTMAALGQARLAVESGKFPDAEKLLKPMLASHAKTIVPQPADGPALCQSHYLMGRVREAEGDHQAALEHYLKAFAVFPFDRNAAAAAQTRADALRKDHPGLIAP